MIRTIIHFTDSSAFGGAEQALLNILAGLDRQSWRSVLFHHPEPGIAPLLERARGLHVKLRLVPRIQRMWNFGRLPQFMRALWSERPSIFHAHLAWPLSCKYGLAGAALARVPAVVATAHSCMELKEHLLRIQPRIIATGMDCYLAVSEAVAQQLINDFGIPAWKIRVLRNGISTASFNRQADIALRDTLTLRKEQPIVLVAARLEKEKGHRYLIEAAAQVPEAVFALAGEGTERTLLETQARELGVDKRVLFLGHREDIPDLLACCDLFVLPSLREGLPLSILEAMAACRPVIASAIGGNDEVIIHGETGLLVPPADPSALARAIQGILSDRDLAQLLATAGRARVNQEFSVETMIHRLTQIYEELLDS